jgi:type I restriction enzyme S subunit
MKRWPTKPLGEVAEVIRGVSFDKSQVFDAPGQKLIPILRAGNIQDSLLTDSDLVYVLCDLVSEQQRMRRGDLAVCMSSGSPAIVGKSAHLEADWDGSVGAFCAIVRFSEKLHHRLGSYWFRSPAFMQWRDNNAKGANIQNLRRTELEKLAIPVPTLAEQERIAKLLDEADELQKLRAQADRRTATLLPALFHEMFGDPATNPKGWPAKRLGDVADTTSGGTPDRKRPEYYGGDIPWVKSGELHEYEVTGTDETLTRLGVENSSAKVMPPGTILLALYGATVGALSLLVIEAATNQAVCCISPRPALNADYLMGAIRLLTPHLLSQRIGGAQPNISQGIVRGLSIPLPPLLLQKEFAQRVTEIRELEAEQAASHRRLDALFQSLLHRAFNGEL